MYEVTELLDMGTTDKVVSQFNNIEDVIRYISDGGQKKVYYIRQYIGNRCVARANAKSASFESDPCHRIILSIPKH